MPKQRREPPPSSSLAHLFDMGAAARAVAIPAATTHPLPEPVAERRAEPTSLQHRSPVADVPPAWGEQPNVKREFVLTASTNEAFERLVEQYRRATGTRLTASHVARAIFKGVSHCMGQLERHARRIGPLKLPPNARGREGERERFEARIADAFVEGIRASAAMDDEEV